MTNGRYKRVRQIGRGSTGTVWLAEDEVLGRLVALKRVGVIPGGVEPDLARAEREARLAASLNHPHVVAVFDLVTEDEEQWLVMEYVDGTSLADLVRQEGPLSRERAAEILEQTADALAAAHAAGIVHRDVKPSNILVSPSGQAKLTDFGIARAEADATLTQTGLVTGSPAYLPPEVAAGRTATPASDVWSFGATLFHCLAGRPPYDVGDNVLGAMYRIVHEEPPRLDDAGWLAPVLEHTMATEIEDRWPMAKVRDVLRSATDDATPQDEGTQVLGTQVLPPPATTPAAGTDGLGQPPSSIAPPVPAAPTRSTSSQQRRWWPWAALAVVVVALSIAAFTLGNDPADPERDRTAASKGPSPSGDEPDGTGTPARSPSPSSSQGPPPEEATITAEEMEAFVITYLDTVTEDPRATWRMLSPEFQAASGNYGRYRGFWSTVADARVGEVRADPGASLVSYDVAYEMENGDVRTDSPTLRLVRQEGTIKIAEES